LPLSVTDRLKVGNARVFVNGLNLLTFDKMGVYDPESEVQSGVFYPQSRVINSGITVSF
jgi:TonB-dependent starch-binding outer membrane protein SusC